MQIGGFLALIPKMYNLPLLLRKGEFHPPFLPSDCFFFWINCIFSSIILRLQVRSNGEGSRFSAGSVHGNRSIRQVRGMLFILHKLAEESNNIYIAKISVVLQQGRDMMKVTIPKPGKEKELETEDEENEGQNVETELKSSRAQSVEDDVAKSIEDGDEEKEAAASKETLDANGEENGAENNEDNRDELSVREEEEEEEEEEEGEEEKKEEKQKKAKSGAKSTTVIIARTHPGETNTSFIVQGWSDRGSTPLFIHSFAMFCYVFLCELRWPAWAVCSYSIGPPARGLSQKTFNKISRTSG